MSPLNTKRLTRRRFVRHVVATAVAATATRPWVLAAAPCAVGPLQQSMQRAAGCCLAWLNRDQQFLPTGGYEVAHDTGRWSIALRLVGPVLACLAALPGTAAPAGPPARNDHVPKLAGEYVHIYNPQPDVYSGRSTAHYTRGVTYSHWRTNDHTFIKGKSSTCSGASGIRPIRAPTAIVHGPTSIVPTSLRIFATRRWWPNLRRTRPRSFRTKRGNGTSPAPTTRRRAFTWPAWRGSSQRRTTAWKKDRP